MEKITVILNKVKSLELKEIPTNIDVQIKGESPSIYFNEKNSRKRVQGLIVEILGKRSEIDSFLENYKNSGVFTK